MSAYTGPIAVPAMPPASNNNLASLVVEISSVCPRPVDSLQIAALLESTGVTDSVAQERYGHDNVFDLARMIRQQLPQANGNRSQVGHVAIPPDSRLERWLSYLRGPLALLPMLLLTLLIMTYQGFGQWNAAQVLTLSLTVVGSLLVTSGFVQVASRKGSSYLSQGYVLAASRVVAIIIGIGLLVVILTAGIFAAFALGTGWLAIDQLGVITTAFIALCVLWLAAGVLFLLDEVHWFGIGLGIGFAFSYLSLWSLYWLNVERSMVMLTSTLVGLIVALLVMAQVTQRAVARRVKASPVGVQPIELPPLAQIVIDLLPYFVYGVLYVVLILAGHVAGWLGLFSNDASALSALSSIEMGLTVALAGYILAVGTAEHTMTRFWQRVNVYQARTLQTEPAHFNKLVRSFMAQEQARFRTILLLYSAAVLVTMLLVVGLSRQAGLVLLPWSTETSVVLGLGLIGYGLMALGVFKSMFMITLSRPDPAIRALLVGILVTLITGLVISQVAAIELSVLGVVAGSLAFLLTASNDLNHILVHADFYYYSSF